MTVVQWNFTSSPDHVSKRRKFVDLTRSGANSVNVRLVSSGGNSLTARRTVERRQEADPMCQEDGPPCVMGRATGRFTKSEWRLSEAALRGKCWSLGELPDSGLSGLGGVQAQIITRLRAQAQERGRMAYSEAKRRCFFERWCDSLTGSHSVREEQNGCVSTRALDYKGSENFSIGDAGYGAGGRCSTGAHAGTPPTQEERQ